MSTQTGDPTPALGGLLADVPLPLLHATRRALETLARHWPKAMAAAVGRSEADGMLVACTFGLRLHVSAKVPAGTVLLRELPPEVR